MIAQAQQPNKRPAEAYLALPRPVKALALPQVRRITFRYFNPTNASYCAWEPIQYQTLILSSIM